MTEDEKTETTSNEDNTEEESVEEEIIEEETVEEETVEEEVIVEEPVAEDEVAADETVVEEEEPIGEEIAIDVTSPDTAPEAKKDKKKKFKPAGVLYWGVGRRKESVARVRLVPGTGQMNVNGKTIQEYFCMQKLCDIVVQPLVLTGNVSTFDVFANIKGGGFTGQAGALRHGIARALLEADPELRASLKKAGMLARDAREKERRKYGLKKARKRPQFSKR